MSWSPQPLLLAFCFCLAANAGATADLPPKGHTPRSDRFGDALPAGAQARLGTVRFRHGGSVYCAHFSADGKTLTSYGADNVFRIWDAASGKELRCCRRRGVQAEFFGSAALSADGRLLALGCGARGHEKDGTVALCAAETGEELHNLAVPDCGWAVRSLAFSADGKLVAGGDDHGHIDIWATATGRKRRRLNWECAVRGLAFSPDGRLLASGNGRDVLWLWDVTGGKKVRCLQKDAPGFVGKNSFESHLAFTPDGKTLASANSDNAVRLWDVASGKMLRRLHREEEGVAADDFFKSVHGLAFSPDGKLLAVDSADGFLHLWSVATGEKCRRIDTQHGLYGWRYSVALAFAPDGRTLAAWGTENAIRLWDVGTGKEQAVRQAHRGTVRTVAFSADGGKIATAGEDRRVRLWSPADGRSRQALIPPKGFHEIRSVAFSPDGRLLASTGEYDAIYCWRIAKGAPLPSLTAKGASNVHAVAFTPKCGLLATADSRSTGSGSVILWEPKTGKELRKWEVEQQYLGLAFSPDGSLLAACGGEWTSRGHPLVGIKTDYRGGIDLWDPSTGRKLRRWTIADSMVTAVAFTPNGRWLASVGEQDRTLQLWDAGTGQAFRRWKDADCVAISPAGRLIAAGDRNGVVRLWDYYGGESIAQLQGHRGPVCSLAFAPDGRTLVSGSADTTALVWDMTALYPQRRSAGAPLTAAQREAFWNDLRGEGAIAYRAIAGLAADAERSVPLLQRRLAAVCDTPEGIAALIRDLDSDEFMTREKALAELEKVGAAALPALRKCLAGKPSLEQRRRIELLLKKPPGAIETAGCRQALHGVEVLEAAATPKARRLLEKVAEGDSAVYVRREAKAALQRLRSRLPAIPESQPSR